MPLDPRSATPLSRPIFARRPQKSRRKWQHAPLSRQREKGLRLSRRVRPALTTLWQSIVDELADPQPPAATDAWHWPAVLALVLMVAMACGLGWLVLGIVAVRRQRARSRPLRDGPLLELVDVLRAELGCRRPIEVCQSDDLVTAAAIGWRRPVVLLPADWTTWTPAQRRAVLAHEIAHARSHDFLAVLLGQLGLVLHFYHPLLHWLMNRLRLEQELAADARRRPAFLAASGAT